MVFENNSMNWVPVESSVFDAASYLYSKHLLYLKFRSGDVYRYFDFPPERFKEFLEASSKGRYFADSIRNRYRYEQVPGSALSAFHASV